VTGRPEDNEMLRRAIGVSIGWLGISMVADSLPALLLPHQLLADGNADATTLGLITLAAIGIAAMLQPVAGWVSDRTGRYVVIVAGTIIAVIGLALLLAPGRAVAGTFVALGGVSIAQAGQQALLPDRVRSDWRGRAGGLKSAFDVAGAFAGFLFLGALLGRGQSALAAGALGAALVAGAVLTRVLAGGVAQAALPREHRAHDGSAAFVRLIAARFLFLLGIYAVGRFLLLFIADRFRLGADAASGEAGLVLALLALVTIVASVPSGWLADRIGRRPLMVGGGVVGALGIALLPIAGSMESVLAFGALMALGSAAFGSASWAMLADFVPSARAGRLMGAANLGTAGAAAAAGLFGYLVDAAGFGPTFAAAAAMSLAGGAVAWTLGDRPRQSRLLIDSTEGAH
jgi:MFS family permease